jgi:hypothetical protein
VKKFDETVVELDPKSGQLDHDHAGPLLSAGNISLFAAIMPLYANLFAVFYRSG